MKVRNTSSLTAALALVALLGSALGCAFGEIYWSDPLKRGYTLREAQHRYTALVRWSKFSEAAAYVDQEERQRFVQQAPPIEVLRFTDYASGPVDIDDETGTATVKVTYFAYQPSSPVQIEIRETQEWSRAGVSNDWRVKPTFSGLEKLVMERSGS
jgi:hypothetical protein